MAVYAILSLLVMNMSPSDTRKKLATASVGRHHSSNECRSQSHRKKYVRQWSTAKAIRKRACIYT